MNGPQANNVTVERVRSPTDIDAATKLIWGFFDHLRERYSERREDIDTYIVAQDVKGQIENFGTRFVPPNGECVLARLDGAPVGIVMLKRVDSELCEMNPLFAVDAARGFGVGKKLVAGLLDAARDMGFSSMRLDAWDRHQEALPLYESFGFEYYSEPNESLQAMKYQPVQMRRKL